MLDILFVLLLFFMVSAMAQKHEATLTTQLPGGSPGPVKDIPIQVAIDEDGQASISGADIDDNKDHHMPGLVARLKKIVSGNANHPVIVTPSRSTRQQRVVDVLNACAAAGVKNLAFGSPND